LPATNDMSLDREQEKPLLSVPETTLRTEAAPQGGESGNRGRGGRVPHPGGLGFGEKNVFKHL